MKRQTYRKIIRILLSAIVMLTFTSSAAAHEVVAPDVEISNINSNNNEEINNVLELTEEEENLQIQKDTSIMTKEVFEETTDDVKNDLVIKKIQVLFPHLS